MPTLEVDFGPAGSFIDLREDQSSMVDTIEYHITNGTMDVEFRSTPEVMYTYYHIPPQLWMQLLRGAPAKDGTLWSIGAAFHKYIVKKPHIYPFVKREKHGRTI